VTFHQNVFQLRLGFWLSFNIHQVGLCSISDILDSLNGGEE